MKMRLLTVLPVLLAANLLLGEPVLTLESEATGKKLGPFRLWHGRKIVIRGERYKVLLDKPRTTGKKLDRIIVPKFPVSKQNGRWREYPRFCTEPQDLRDLLQAFMVRTKELDPDGQGVSVVLLPGKRAEDKDYEKRPAPLNFWEEDLTAREVLSHICRVFSVQYAIIDNAVVVGPPGHEGLKETEE